MVYTSALSFLMFIIYDAAYSWHLQIMKYGTLLTGISYIWYGRPSAVDIILCEWHSIRSLVQWSERIEIPSSI